MAIVLGEIVSSFWHFFRTISGKVVRPLVETYLTTSQKPDPKKRQQNPTHISTPQRGPDFGDQNAVRFRCPKLDPKSGTKNGIKTGHQNRHQKPDPISGPIPEPKNGYQNLIRF